MSSDLSEAEPVATSAPRAVIDQVELHDRIVAVDWNDGHRSRFHSIWLRDNCPCAECCATGTSQRLMDATSIPEDIVPQSVNLDGAGDLEITWQPVEHKSVFAAGWLRDHCYSQAALKRRRANPILWGTEISDKLPQTDYAAAQSTDAQMFRWLAMVRDYGFALLQGVPAVPGEVIKVASLVGYVRQTNYGRIFDVKSVPNPSNLAFSGLGLSVHTDNPYRDPTPGLQLLHCLKADATGGETILVDGFRAADELRRIEPRAFELLSVVPRHFRYRDDETDLRCETPLIRVGFDGRVIGVRYNNRSASTLAVPEELVEPYYAAYRAFGQLLQRPELELRLKLQPGDLLMFDNERLLHGRTAYDANSGQRHLQGCYIDRDEMTSRLRVLARKLNLDGLDPGQPGGVRLSDAAKERNNSMPADCADERGFGVIEEIFDLVGKRGGAAYLGEAVTQKQHMLQAAHAAERDGAGSVMITAALLHDIGHFLHKFDEDCAADGIDSQHEDAGAAWLQRHFGPEVTEPVRLHVAAKRYLCAVDADYFGTLSAASVLSLKLQGGPFTPDEVKAFDQNPFAADSVALRRWDDVAKDTNQTTPDLIHFRSHLETCLKQCRQKKDE